MATKPKYAQLKDNLEQHADYCLVSWASNPQAAYEELEELHTKECDENETICLILVGMGANFMPFVRYDDRFEVTLVTPYIGLQSLGIPSFVPKIVVTLFLWISAPKRPQKAFLGSAMINPKAEIRQLVFGANINWVDARKRPVFLLENDKIIKKYPLKFKTVYHFSGEKHGEIGKRFWHCFENRI